MKLRFDKKTIGNPIVFIRRCGYGEYYDRRLGQTSFMKRARMSDMFPRFHVYIEEKNEYIDINLHLDQKRPSYLGSRAHSGDYDGPAVEKEAQRIKDRAEKME